MAKTILIVLILAGALALVVGCERDSAERPADDVGSTGAVSTEGGQQSATSSDSGLSAKPDAEAYIQMAMESSVGKDLGLSLFPRKPKTTVCVIPGGGPHPVSAFRAPAAQPFAWAETTRRPFASSSIGTLGASTDPAPAGAATSATPGS
jgi:hypothetical protein